MRQKEAQKTANPGKGTEKINPWRGVLVVQVQIRQEEYKESVRREKLEAYPFLKWAGGKASLLEQFKPLFPTQFDSYFEPFIGGAAVYLYLQPERSVISDINPRLIDTYLSIRDEPEEVISHLVALRAAHSKEHYYASRERLNENKALSRPERAALQVYLNKTCFNGLYRENRRGDFNVPLGRYQNPSVFDAINIKNVSSCLKKADIICQPFEHILERAVAGDFIYLDPPYMPVSETSNFTSFTRFGFGLFDQERLAEVCRILDDRGCLFMQSNSDVPLLSELYSGFHISRVDARRNINSKGGRRGPVKELVIRNYR